MSQTSHESRDGRPPSPANRVLIGDGPSAGRGDIPGVATDTSSGLPDNAGWAEALLEAEGPILLMIGAGRPLVETLETLCLMVETLCPGVVGVVMLLEPDGLRLRWAAAPSLSDEGRSGLEALPVGPGGGSCGAAARSGEPVVSTDIANDPAWSSLASLTTAHGLRACLATPFRSAAGEVLGTFAAYLCEPRPPTARESRVARRAAKLAALAVERHRADAGYRRIVETALEGVWQIDTGLRTTFVNTRLAQMLGYDPEELMGRPIRELMFAEDLGESMAQWERRLRGEPGAVEFRWRRKDGGEVWTHCAISRVDGPDGRFAGALGMVTDITERRRADQQLREGEQRFRDLMEQAPFSIQVFAPDGRAVRANRAWERLWGVRFDEIPDYNILHDAQLEARGVLPSIQRAFAGEAVAVPAIRYDPNETIPGRTRHTDPRRWVAAVAYPLKDDAGRVREVVLIHEDITERVRAEEALRESEEHYRAVYDQAAVGIAEVDLDGRFLRANDRYCEIVGYPRETLLTLRFQDITHPGDLPANLGLFDQIARRDSAYRIEKRYLRPDGREVWVRAAVSLVRDGSGRPAGVVAVAEDITERVRAEVALRESEARFARFMQQLPGLAWIKDAQGRYLYANDAAERAFQTPRSRLYGRTDEEIFPTETAARFREHDERALESPTGLQVVETLEHADGVLHHSLVSKFPIPDPVSGATWVGGMAIDITDRLRAEEALRESEERFRYLAGAMPQIVWIARPDHSVEFYNERWFDYTGLSPEQAYGLEGWRSVVHPDDLARIIEAGTLSRGPTAPFEAEYRLRNRHGIYRWHLGRAVPVLDASGNLMRRLGTATDIDDRRRAEQDAHFLAEAGAALAALTDEAEALRRVARLAVPHFADWCAVDLLDDGGSLHRLAVAHADPAKVELGYDLHRRYPTRPDSPQGVYEVIQTGESVLVPEITDEMLASGAQDAEHLRILRDLGLRSYLCVPLVGRKGPLGAIAFIAAESGRCYGLDNLRLAEELAHRAAIAVENARLYDALREADRRKGEFLATLAHELRNPLAPVRNAARLLAEIPAVVAAAGDEVGMIERQAAHLARLVDDLMDVARIEQGKIGLRREVVELAPVVRHAVASVRPAAESQHHQLITSLPAEPILLEADPARLEQVLANMLTNAIKYTAPGGQIKLEAGRDGSEAVIRVRDTGVGIPPEKLPHVFEMFVQVDQGSARSQSGLGIGLGLVKTLVEMHGGTITASSAGPGQGSEFVVSLPTLAAAALERSKPEPRLPVSSKAALPRRRILVVDDNRDAASSLARVLERLYGQEVRVVHDGPEALVAAGEFRPEIVLLDIGMPGMDGYEVAGRLRSRPEFAEMTLVALTGWGQETDRQKSRAAGFNCHLVKPVDPEAIRSLLADATSPATKAVRKSEAP